MFLRRSLSATWCGKDVNGFFVESEAFTSARVFPTAYLSHFYFLGFNEPAKHTFLVPDSRRAAAGSV